MKNYVITIARGMGSGGSHIGHDLCARLGISYYDEDILKMASVESGINENYFFQACERIRKRDSKIQASKGIYTGNVYDVNSPMFLSDENLFNYQALVIRKLALEQKESCVIIGKAANRIIGSLKNVLTVNIVAPHDLCVRNIENRLGYSPEEAEKTVLRTDKYRSDYYKYYTGGEWLNPKEYDLTVNTGFTGEKFAADLIIEHLKHMGAPV